jgi:hypothetical protein
MNYYWTKRREGTLPEKPAMAVTLVTCLTCWLTGYFYPAVFPLNSTGKIFINREISCTVGLLAVLTVGFAIQKINDSEMLIRERTRLPFMFFLLFFSTHAGLPPVSAATAVILCFVFLLGELFRTYQKPEATVSFFNVGAYLGFASLFVPQMLFFAPAIWLGMYNFRSLEAKSFLATLTGILTIYWILLAWCLWTRDFSFYAEWFNDLIRIRFFPVASLLQYHRWALMEILILTLISCFQVKRESFYNNVRPRMMLSLLINISLMLVLMILLYGDRTDIFQAILYLPVAVLIACFLNTVKKRIRFVLYYFILIPLLFSFIAFIWNF